jgi:hypothetical protein
MSPKIFVVAFVLCCLSIAAHSQGNAFNPVNFTWEGAPTGNKAKWKANDTFNEYKNVGGVDVKVKMIDPFGVNTTTAHPSEFNDWTKTNTFYGKGNFAVQITSTASRQPVCLEFSFSKPVYLNRFNVYDIDMIQSGSNLWSTYQDSIYVFASNINGNVPLIFQSITANPTYTIYNQSAKARYLIGVNGDVSHYDPDGAVRIYSLVPVEVFTLCYANGSEDDGLSNSHAISIPGFEFAELIGSISGYVLEDLTDKPLAGSLLTLYNDNGQPVTNKAGVLMQQITGADGYYNFPLLPMGKYRVVQVNPPDYLSVRDTDGPNDEMINATLDINYPNSMNNNFYEIQTAPLAANLSDIWLRQLSKNNYLLRWKAAAETNIDYYDIALSEDRAIFYSAGTVKSFNKVGMLYDFNFISIASGKVYVRLSQSDYDGKTVVLGTLSLDDNIAIAAPIVYPNPFSEGVTIDVSGIEDNFERYQLYNTQQQIVASGYITSGTSKIMLELKSYARGIYYLTLYGGQKNKVLMLVKQ